MLSKTHKELISLANRKKLFSIVPELRELQNQYDMMNASSNKDRTNNPCDQKFKKTWNIGNGESFDLIWCIGKLKELVNYHNIQLSTFAISSLESSPEKTFKSQVDMYKAKKEIDPVIVIEFKGLLLVADGNHRVCSFIECKKSDIIGYYIPSNIHINGLVSNQQEALYIYQHNINLFCNLLLTNNIFNKMSINNSFSLDSFYSKSVTLNISILQKTRIVLGI